MRKKHWNGDLYQAHSLWYMLNNLEEEEEKDKFLESLGLSRIQKIKDKYFILTYIPDYSLSEKGLYKTNLKIIDKKKYLLAKIKYAI